MAIRKTMLRKIQRLIKEDFESEGLLDQALEWVTEVVQPWLADMFGDEDRVKQWIALASNEHTTSKLTLMAADSFLQVRQGEIFEVVADYPDSHPAVVELSKVLQITQRDTELGQSCVKA